MIVNGQQQHAVNLRALRAYVRSLKRILRLGCRDFNVCLVNDREIERLNATYLGKHRSTDVLSFPWQVGEGSALPRAQRVKGRRSGQRQGRGGNGPPEAEFNNFLGDVVISVETARRNARREGHSTFKETRWLILHGVLHLLGYDHERDQGEMTGLEVTLRERLGMEGFQKPRRGRKQVGSRHG